MAISAECPSCHASVKVPASLIGKTAPCPKCGTRVRVDVVLSAVEEGSASQPEAAPANEEPAIATVIDPVEAEVVENNEKGHARDSRKKVRHFFTKVRGVTQRNSDGTLRQDIIPECSPCERLVLEHEEDNPADPNAVKVCRHGGRQIGYLYRELAREIVANSKRGYKYGAWVAGVSGGTRGNRVRGVNLVLLVHEPGATDEEVQHYIDTEIVIDSPYSGFDDDGYD